MMRKHFVLISTCGDHRVAMYNVFLYIYYIFMISLLSRAEQIYPDVRQKGKKEKHF